MLYKRAGQKLDYSTLEHPKQAEEQGYCFLGVFVALFQLTCSYATLYVLVGD